MRASPEIFVGIVAWLDLGASSSSSQIISLNNLRKAMEMSAGNITDCVKLCFKLGKALKDSGGSIAKYQNAFELLQGMEKTVQGVKALLQKHPEAEFRDDLEKHAENLINAVTHFRDKIEGYDNSLGASATAPEFKKAYKKIKFALFGDIEELQDAVSHPQKVLSSLLQLQEL